MYRPRDGSPPLFVPCDLPYEARRDLAEIPGVRTTRGGLICSWDVVGILSKILEQPVPSTPRPWLAEGDASNFLSTDHLDRPFRAHQIPGAVWLANQDAGILADCMRAGKCRTSLTATKLLSLKLGRPPRVLIISPSIVKYVWMDEIWKWMGEASLILEGRGGDRGKAACSECRGTGKTEAVSEAVSEATAQQTPRPTCPCPACVKKKSKVPPTRGRGYIELKTEDDVKRHLRDLRFTICSYDCLIPQHRSNARGKLLGRQDLPGLGPTIQAGAFDVVICDESHYVRGWQKKDKHDTLADETRRDCLIKATDEIPIMWMLTGTPIFGYPRDLWSQIDILTRGASSGSKSRLPFSWHARYCDGRRNEWGGWIADGESNSKELAARLPFLMIKRDRDQIASDAPDKIRQLVKIDADPTALAKISKAKLKGTGSQKVVEAFRRVLPLKLPTITERIWSELSEGGKVVAFTYFVDSVALVHTALLKEANAKDNSPRLKRINLRTFAVSGEQTPDQRAVACKEFIHHDGAALFVATTRSIPVGVSLAGAWSVHFAEPDYDANAMLQAEERPNELSRTRGLGVYYYAILGTRDEEMIDLLQSKVAAQEALYTDKSASNFATTLNTVSDELALDDLLSMLEGTLVDEDL